MLVAEEHIIEEVEVSPEDVQRDRPGVQLQYNHTEPGLIRDGIDFVSVMEDGEAYRVEYWGFSCGRLRVTADGVEELGQRLVAEVGEIPSWTVDPETVDVDDPPWWIPEGAAAVPSVTCGNCGATASVRDVVTPNRIPDEMDGPVICRACWEER